MNFKLETNNTVLHRVFGECAIEAKCTDSNKQKVSVKMTKEGLGFTIGAVLSLAVKRNSLLLCLSGLSGIAISKAISSRDVSFHFKTQFFMKESSVPSNELMENTSDK